MTEIYLIRHAQAEGNLYRMMQGHWDGQLTALGLRQTEALGRRFEGQRIDAVYSSDLQRARITGEAVAKRFGLTVKTLPEIREIDVGPWESGFFADIRHVKPELMQSFIADPESWQLEGAETYGQVRERAYKAICRLAEEHEGEAIAIASHGITIRCFISKVSGIPLTDTQSLPIFGNTAVTRLFYENGSFRIDYMNDCTHLSEVDAPVWSRSPDLRGESFNPADDKDYYCSCYADAWQSAHGSLECFTPGPYYRAALEHYTFNPEAVRRIYDGEDSVGLIDLDPMRGSAEGCGWISLIWLRQDYRRRGCGIQLLARAMVFYRKLGRKSLRLNVADSNTDALDFYQRWGFREVSRQRSSLGYLILMEREL